MSSESDLKASQVGLEGKELPVLPLREVGQSS